VGDVFDGVLGQDRAVTALRHHARAPVHAYLFTGPAGAGMREALVAFVAALQCPEQGCGRCEACRLVAAGADPDVTFLGRAGVNWSVDELGEAERISRRRPLGRGHQIVVIENVELAAASAGKLLKILEEPPTRTVFLLSAESLPESLVTVQSRCLEVAFAPLSEDVISDYLTRQGCEVVAARAAAAASGGDLRRAQVLARDEALATRVAAWRSVPERLDGASSRASELVAELGAAVDAALAPLVALQEEELARLTANAREMGQRALPGRREVEARFKREQRRFRQEDLRFGLSALTLAYRERLLEGLEGLDDGDRRGRVLVRGAIEAIELIDATARELAGNVDETLALTNLLLSLSRC
jgi:DNA polymerase-3 subunit delta'